jgi:hypothetical protein
MSKIISIEPQKPAPVLGKIQINFINTDLNISFSQNRSPRLQNHSRNYSRTTPIIEKIAVTMQKISDLHLTRLESVEPPAATLPKSSHTYGNNHDLYYWFDRVLHTSLHHIIRRQPTIGVVRHPHTRDDLGYHHCLPLP